MTRWLTDDEQHAWRAWVTATSQLEAHLAREMQASGEISMADFAVLVPLSEAADGRLRAFELGRHLQWEKSRLSHQITRMEGRGLVCRESCGTDRRGAFVGITPTGRAAIEAAAPPHVEAVRAAFFDVLEPDEVAVLDAACTRIVERLAATPACTEAAAAAPDC